MTEQIAYKPPLGCLLTHQPAWEFLGILKENGRDVFECCRCKLKFMYPTKKDEEPKYGKD